MDVWESQRSSSPSPKWKLEESPIGSMESLNCTNASLSPGVWTIPWWYKPSPQSTNTVSPAWRLETRHGFQGPQPWVLTPSDWAASTKMFSRRLGASARKHLFMGKLERCGPSPLRWRRAVWYTLFWTDTFREFRFRPPSFLLVYLSFSDTKPDTLLFEQSSDQMALS